MKNFLSDTLSWEKIHWSWPLAGGILACLVLPLLQAQEIEARQGTDPELSIPMVASIEIPRIRVREYHRPYVAVWIEDEDRQLIQHLSVWYQQGKNDEGHGKKWLPDLRQWWRRGGRKLVVPVDGISGATRAVGKHKIRISSRRLQNLKPGTYHLVVEAAREVGGRELVRLPFQWPVAESMQVQESGETELGEITLKVNPISIN